LKDIVRVENEYYVRATSALADDRTRVLKSGKTFAVFNRYGDIEALGPLRFGLFYAETRHLSHLTLRINERQPMLLSSTVREDNSSTVLGCDDSHGVGAFHCIRAIQLANAVFQQGQHQPTSSPSSKQQGRLGGSLGNRGQRRRQPFFRDRTRD
jgi:hypothetical protein